MTDKQERAQERAQAERAPDRPTAAQMQAAERVGVVLESEDARRSRAMAEAQAEATRLKMDETEAGGGTHPGFYIVNGVKVNPDGTPFKDAKD
jgi:hypothetical protein